MAAPPAVIVASDSTLNDFDKTLTVTTGKVWEIQTFRLEYTASAVAGTRTVEVRVRDAADDVMWATEITTDFIVSDVMVVNFSPAAPLVVPVDAGDEGSQHIPGMLMGSGWDLQAVATAGGDAGDDMVMHLTVREHG